MPNIAYVLKPESLRLARKEARNEIKSLEKVSIQYRSEIAQPKVNTHLSQSLDDRFDYWLTG